jgi:hypothetical protein
MPLAQGDLEGYRAKLVALDEVLKVELARLRGSLDPDWRLRAPQLLQQALQKGKK